MTTGVRVLTLLLACTLQLLPAAAAQTASRSALHRPLDEVLDLYVRDGLVYYRALKSDRRKLDAYIASLAAVTSSEL